MNVFRAPIASQTNLNIETKFEKLEIRCLEFIGKILLKPEHHLHICKQSYLVPLFRSGQLPVFTLV